MTRTRGEMQRILSVFGDAASADATTTAADATTTERDEDSVDEHGRYDESPTETGRFWQQQYD
jgi:hypothetical protein